MKRRTLVDAMPAAAPGPDLLPLLGSAEILKAAVPYQRGEAVYKQGDACEHVFYVQTGSIKLSVSSKAGRESVIGIFGPGDFFGEGCLTGLATRMGSATAMAPSVVIRIPKDRMATLLRRQHAMSDRFIAYMLARNLRVEEDLLDQLFNSSEKRLARALLLLAPDEHQSRPPRVAPKISQEMLAEMIGTTRSRVNFFLNKFKRLGLIEYGEEHPIEINKPLLSAFLEE